MLKVQTSVCKKRSGWCNNFTKWNESDECGSQVKTKRDSHQIREKIHAGIANLWSSRLKSSCFCVFSWCSLCIQVKNGEFENSSFIAYFKIHIMLLLALCPRSAVISWLKKISCLCCHTAKIASCNRYCAGDWGCALIAFCFLSERDFQNKGSKMKSWRFQQTREPSSNTHASTLCKMWKIRTYYTRNLIVRHTTNHNHYNFLKFDWCINCFIFHYIIV